MTDKPISVRVESANADECSIVDICRDVVAMADELREISKRRAEAVAICEAQRERIYELEARIKELESR